MSPPKLAGHMLIDPSHREAVGRCQAWRRLVARKPLHWVIEKVCYTVGGADILGGGTGASSEPSSTATHVGGAVSNLLKQIFEGDVPNSLTNDDVANAKYWEAPSEGTQVAYVGTFFSIGSGMGISEGTRSVLSHGGSAATSSSAPAVTPGMIERPELFMCLLFRALMLSEHLPSNVILNMIAQGQSKYLRVFGLFVGRFLFVGRGEPELMKQAWEMCAEDTRSVRVLRTKGGRSVVGIETVDSVAFELVTSKQWEGNLTFPWCKPLK